MSGMKTGFELDNIYNMDCLEGMSSIPDGSVDLVVTDPPYRITATGNVNGTMGGYMNNTELGRKGKIFENNDIDIEDYLPHFHRVLKEDAHCYIMCNNLNLPHFFDVVSKSGFRFIKLLVWDKQNKICGRYYMSQVEHIFLLRKGADKKINDCGVSDLISIPNLKEKTMEGRNVHDSQKPVELMKVFIECSSLPGEVVLDPFMGSGTTAVAAVESGRRFIGFEIDPEYHRDSLKRLDEIRRAENKKLF